MDIFRRIDEVAKHSEFVLTLTEYVRFALGFVRIRLTPLWAEVQPFELWMENHVLPPAREDGREKCTFLIDPQQGDDFLFRPLNVDEDARAFPRLGRFLARLGLRRLELDVRLESNQITDLPTLLYTWQDALCRRDDKRLDKSRLRFLVGRTGLQLSCTRTWLTGDTFRVEYSYCTTRFSQLVAVFEKRNRKFQDHRVLFYVAPRFALLVAVVAVIPFILYTLFSHWWLLAMVTFLGALALFSMVFLLLMTIGSVEYDNEENNYRLAVAHQKLQLFADHLSDDLGRARNIQENLLPRKSAMPLADRLERVFSFMPETEVGGDYFDVACLDDDRVAILFADVSGHGMSAALVTTMIKTAFEGWKSSDQSLESFARQLNGLLCRVTPTKSSAAMIIGVLDTANRRSTYLNCGHNPEPLLLPADGAQPGRFLQEANAMILGVMEDITLQPVSIMLQPGGQLVLSTDGIIEAGDVEVEMFGVERLLQCALDGRSEHPELVVNSIMNEVRDFAGAIPQNDDRMVLAIRLMGDA
ncbi:MAG: SpoIIE family protein phosphatase [Acidobacteria bacterium]|nr:SpoIIE family protein phosphatase [Acidobacteriota bacterium]